MYSLEQVTSQSSSTSTLVNPIPDFEGTPTEQEHKTHFLHLFCVFGRVPVHQSYFRSWCLKEPRPAWTNIFFSNSDWDTSKFGDVLDEFQSLYLGSMSGSWWNFEFLLAEDARDRLLTCLGEEETRLCRGIVFPIGRSFEHSWPFQPLVD